MMNIVWAFPHKLIGIIAIIPCLLLGFGFMFAQANYDCIAKKKKIDKNELPVTDAVIAEMDKCQKSMNAQKKYPILRAYMWKNDIPLDLNTVKG